MITMISRVVARSRLLHGTCHDGRLWIRFPLLYVLRICQFHYLYIVLYVARTQIQDSGKSAGRLRQSTQLL